MRKFQVVLEKLCEKLLTLDEKQRFTSVVLSKGLNTSVELKAEFKSFKGSNEKSN